MLVARLAACGAALLRLLVYASLVEQRSACGVLITGVYGSGNRHRRWSLDGTWEQILDGLRAGCDEAEGRDWTVSADSTVARARQHAAGARRLRAADDRAGGFSE